MESLNEILKLNAREASSDNGPASTKNEKTEKRSGRSTSSDSESLALRVRLPVTVDERVRKILNELKQRGSSISPELILSKFWEQLTDSYLEEQLVRNTREEYFLEEASKIPEIREKLIQQAKKALSAVASGPKPVKKRVRQPKVTIPGDGKTV